MTDLQKVASVLYRVKEAAYEATYAAAYAATHEAADVAARVAIYAAIGVAVDMDHPSTASPRRGTCGRPSPRTSRTWWGPFNGTRACCGPTPTASGASTRAPASSERWRRPRLARCGWTSSPPPSKMTVEV